MKRKLGTAALACMIVVAVIIMLYFLDPETWNDGPLMVASSASGMALVMFIVNAWYLSVSHAPGLVSSYVAEANLGQQETSGGID